MKNLYLLVFSICLMVIIPCKAQVSNHPYRWYPFQNKSTPVLVDSKLADSFKTTPNSFTTKDSSIFFGPSVSFDVFQKEKATGSYTLGVIPGVGYGIKYNPFLWSNSYLVGIDLFAQAGLSGGNNLSSTGQTSATNQTFQYFIVDVVPVISIMNWIHVGWGPRFKIGLNGIPNANTSTFTIGISKAL